MVGIKKARLSAGAATAAIALSIAYSPASAACTANSSTVTCTSATPVTDVNDTVNSVPPPSVTLNVAAGATVVRDNDETIEPSNTFVGAVGFNNAGTLGTAALPVNFEYEGNYDASATAAANAANTVAIENSGAITGFVDVFNVGGAVTVGNTGTIGGGAFLFAAGNVSLTSSGTIYQTGGNTAIEVVAGRNDEGEPAVLSNATVTLTGPVAIPATAGADATPAQPQDVFVFATGASTLSADALAGNLFARSSATNSTSTSTTSGGTTTSSGDTVDVGGNSLITIGAAGQASGASAFSNAGTATIDVLGSIGSDADPDAIQTGNAAATTSGSHRTSNSTTTTATNDAGTTTTSTSTTTNTALGGAAAVDVAEGAAVIGDVSASSGAGDATVTIEGQVGSGSGRSVAAAGNVSATAQGQDTTSTTASVDGPGNDSTTTTTGATVRGGNASVTVANGSDVYGSVTAGGDLSASVDNAGRLHGTGGNLSANSARNLQTASTDNSSSTTTTAADGTVTTVTALPGEENVSSTTSTVGGTASAVNRATGIVDGAVSVSGLGGASFQNSGAVFGNVTLASTGSTNSFARTFVITDVTPGTEAGTSSTSEVITSNSTNTATGGNVTGVYGGTIGALQNVDNSGTLPQSTLISQTADGSSNAALSGTIYANFIGTAGGANNSFSSSFNDSDVTVPGTTPAPTVETSTSSGNSASSVSYGTGASNATVTGRVLNNGNNTGSLTLRANAGDANLVVNGGTIGANASNAATYSAGAAVLAGAAQNVTTTNTSNSVATTSGTGPETDQSESFTSSYVRTGNTGAASATLTNAKLGSLNVIGVGTVPGSNGASATMDAASVVDGTVNVAILASGSGGIDEDVAQTLFVNGPSFSTLNDTYTTSNVATRGADGTVTRTVTSSDTRTNGGGDASATIAGKTNFLSVTAPVGNATATLTGQATEGVDVAAIGVNSTAQSTETYRGTSRTSLSTPLLTESDGSSTTTVTGGTASLAINTAANLANRNAAAVSTGAIVVEGLAGSSLTIAAGSRVFPTLTADEGEGEFEGGFIQVGRLGFDDGRYNTTTTTAQSFDRNGASTATSHTTSTAVGGTATFTNAGTIGSRTATIPTIPIPTDGVSVAAIGDGGADVVVEGLGGASATNSGRIYGSILADAVDQNRDITSSSSNLADAVTSTTTTTDAITSVGGDASITNSGLVTGTVESHGATGTIANSGVIEGPALVGVYVNDAVTNTNSTATASETTQTAPSTLFTQNYTVNQNGLLIGGVDVAGAYKADGSTTPADPVHQVFKNTQINATVNLNSGSITLGNITAETLASTPDNVGPVDPADTLVRATSTTVNLNGTGFLGACSCQQPAQRTSTPDLGSVIGNLLGQTAATYTYTPDYRPYVALDPALGTIDITGRFVPSAQVATAADVGSRIIGVETVDKIGTGTFTINGSAYRVPTGDNPNAAYTLDVGTLRTSGGELQLGVAGTDPTTGAAIFGIRGNVENNAALMLGRSVSFGSTVVTEGINARVEGNFTQSAAGTLEVGATPALVRQFGTLVLPAQAQGLLGYGQYGVTLSPFVPFGQQYFGLTSTPSTLTVTGDLTLAGKVTVAATPGAIYLSGTGRDLFTVDGTFTDNTSMSSGFGSPFVNFKLTPRSVNGATVVSLDVQRTPYASVTTTTNAQAAANALDAAIPNVVATISALPSPQAATDIQAYSYTQDLATVIAALDSTLTSAQATEALNELGTGSFYGSLSAVSTTRTFGDIAAGVDSEKTGFGLWFRPVGDFAHYSGRDSVGASPLHVNNYGGSVGFNLLTDGNGAFGVAGGYAHTRAHDIDTPESAHADTYMVGVYGVRSFDKLNVGGQAVFGWSNWKASRGLPFFDRTANAKFDSKEIRFTAHASYDFDLGGVVASPFAKIDIRHYHFDGFEERNAGGIGLAVDGRSKTVFDPEVGGRIALSTGVVRPYAQASYVFQNHVGTDRDVSYLGDPETSFTLRGVNPKSYANLGVGIQGGVGSATAFVGGNYLVGGHQHAGEIKAGLMIKFF